MSDATLARMEHGKYVRVRGEPRRDGVCVLRKPTLYVQTSVLGVARFFFIDHHDSSDSTYIWNCRSICSTVQKLRGMGGRTDRWTDRPTLGNIEILANLKTVLLGFNPYVWLTLCRI